MTVSKVLQRKMFRDPSQDENVGIMQGFMDDVHEMLGVDDMFDEEPGEEDDGGVTKAMNRRPNSPEILMNTLRGDMRSVDARIEELADMVGYNAAASTPPEVLALLQPMLKQQGIAALETAAPDMPDMGMAPPPGAMGMAPPPGAMGMAPPPDAMGMAPPPGMEGGIGSLPQGDMGQPPMQMARGGPVQYFQDGSDGAGVTSYDAQLTEFLNRKQQEPSDPMLRARELAPLYQELLGTSDKGSAKAQMMFDIAQAALGYAANVGPDGQPLRGSQASRLAGATRALPGQIAARGAQVKEGEARARLAALGQAQSEREAAIAANTALSSDQRAIAMAQQAQANELANRAKFETLTTEELTAAGAPEGSYGQVNTVTGERTISRPPAATNINVGGGKLSDVLSTNAANQLDASYTQATAALGTLNTVNNIRPLLEQELFDGPLSQSAMFVSRLGQSLGVGGESSQEMLQNTVLAMQGLAEFELLAAQAMRGQGAITENERGLIRRASAGDLGTMTQGEVKELMGALEKTANYRISAHENRLAQYTNVLKDDPASTQLLGLYQLRNALPSAPTTTPTPPPPPTLQIDPVAAQAALDRKKAGGP